ncbi:histone deacetylase family protein [Rhizobium rhizogenes]|uniref:Histone deacetylase family protein n=1 Tax=Rhizobium rhizogenes TaxID=359 RepID=A0AA92C060_RHIRH|nr:histone deacetylase family protein [Rhizobium rhizogenes]PVE50600.1 histone deacetylase family protein [Rhizobium rhizogenes]PVE62399.1 histone deacetylase family protein [Agrobacterium tumefaciens]PVE70582.1 histone deacetylase family protein [Sphingomonas sp. TPD3009]
MKVVYTERHRDHIPGDVVENGLARPSRDVPERMDALLRAVHSLGHDVVGADDHGTSPLAAVHSKGYLEFLATVHRDWQRLGLDGRVVPAAFETRQDAYRNDWSPIAKSGFHLRDQITPIGEGTWAAAYWAAQTALTAASLIKEGEQEAYALCRPSGHHAGPDFGAGATYLNNAAIAARFLARDFGRVAVIDVDVHHGNGTQQVFWDDPDVFFASVHRGPETYYPHFCGYTDETGGPSAPNGILNVSLPAQAGDATFVHGFETCVSAVLEHKPRVLVVSLGFDALLTDPSKGLLVSESAFGTVGQLIGAFNMPVLLVQEGGYDLVNLQDVAERFLRGFCSARMPVCNPTQITPT